MAVNGHTRVLVHLAYPAAHVKTPQLFNARCRERQINAILVPWQVHPDALRLTVDALRASDSVAGMIVTMPHKETTAALCNQLDGAAAQLHVANVVRKTEDGALLGRIMDGDGFVTGLYKQGHNPQGKSVLLLGAGGVAIAIAYALLAAGVKRLVINNRTQARAQRAVERLQTLFPKHDIAMGTANAKGFDLVVNASARGMHADDPLPLDATTITATTLVAEVVMDPPLTPLLQAAQSRGATIHTGSHMLTAQIDAFIDFVLGNPDASVQS